ncbi:MAG: CAP domain-containing protein [Planctomycetota bacterium]|jgi:uncharacterized protein YkwD
MTKGQRSAPAPALRHLAACLLALAACGRREPPRAPDLVDLLDEYRRAAGVAALSKDPVLTRTAEGHAAEMARLGYYGHFSPVPDRRSPDDRLAQEGWPADRPYFELLARADTKEAALASWKAKPAYDRALLDPAYTLVGVAHRGPIWVLLLGKGATAGKQNNVTDR